QGYNYYLQGKFGGETVLTEAIGISWRGFARVRSMKDYLTVTSEPGIESTGAFQPTPIRFADKVTGHQQMTMMVKTPDDEEKFIGVMKEFRTETNLINSLLVPSAREIVSNTPYMFTGQAYASGDAPDYKFAVRDQIMNGGYVMEDDEERMQRAKLEQDSLFSVGQDDGGPILLKKPAEGPDGQPLRISSPILEAGLTVTQVTLPDVDFSDGFDQKLEKQREQSALIQQYAIQEKAKIAETALEQASGELEKVKTRMTKEKEAVSEIVAVQTALARDSIALLQAKVLRDKARVDKETEELKADARSYANRKLVAAGLTPQERALWDYRSDSVTAANIAKIKFPEIMFVGDSDGGADPLSSLIGAAMAKQLGVETGNK
ncbi:MAG: hypothetical protein JSW41_04065, partial [Candidatus Aenigmatarchaeota archaeon]